MEREETLKNIDNDNHGSDNTTLPVNPDDYFDENDSFISNESAIIESIAMMSISKHSSVIENGHGGVSTTSRDFVHEVPSCRIYRLEDVEGEYGGKTGLVTLKVLSDQFPTKNDISRLENEYNVLKHLSNRDAAGAALNKTMQDGGAAIYLEWINGITLRDWIRNLHKERALPLALESDDADLKSIIMIAKNIAWNLVDIHDAGVTHNSIRPEHVIVNTDDSCSTKIISFGSASFMTTNGSHAERRNDLISMGYTLYAILSGKSPFRENENERDKQRESPNGELDSNASEQYISHIEVYSVLVNRVSMPFIKIIMALIESSMTTQRYQSAGEVYQDLNQMINCPELFHRKNITHLGQLRFPTDKLYGRNEQLSIIMNACNRMIDMERPSEIFMVSGYSGTGKSSLMKYAGQLLIEKGVHFVSGKYDQLQQADPLSAIVDAFNTFFGNIAQRRAEIVNEMKMSILAAIGPEIGVLTNVFPSLCQLLGGSPSSPVQVPSSAAQNRLKYHFETMIRAIATPSCPLVLFLDDLQWADVSSLELIKSVFASSASKCFLFVGSYRNNELSSSYSLAGFLTDISSRDIPVTEVVLDNINKGDVNELISDAICRPQLETELLAEIVYRKTAGNILFVTQFLQSLYAEGLLQFSLDSESWGWDNVKIAEKIVHDDVVKLLTQRILYLPFFTQLALKLLSCIGCSCDEFTLRLFMDDIERKYTNAREVSTKKESYLLNALGLAINEGLVKKEGSSYNFVHDQIQSVAYSLIPANEQGPLHAQIGYLIMKNVPMDEEENVFFIAVDQLNRGKSFMSESMKVHVAGLNLRAGRKAMKLAAFQSSASYLKAGISLLSDGDWSENHELSLQLYNSYAEAEFCNGRFSDVGDVTATVIKHAKSLWEKLDAYSTLIRSLGSRNKFKEAIEISFAVLADLGEQVPASVHEQLTSAEDMMKSIYIFVEMDDAHFLSLCEMKEKRTIAAMKFLYSLSLYCIMAAPNYIPFVQKRMLDLTLSFGFCKESCAALAGCCHLRSGLAGDLRGSHRLGELALLLLEKSKAEEYAPQVHSLVYTARGWSEQLRQTMKPLYLAYERGMQIGDIQSAMSSAHFYCCKRLFCGVELPIVEKEFRCFCKQMAEYTQKPMLFSTIPFFQAVLNLMGKSGNPLELTGEVMIQEKYLSSCLENNIKVCMGTICGLRGWLAYIFGEYEAALLAMSKRREIEKNIYKKAEWFGMALFFDCLTYLACARMAEEKSLSPNISQNIEKMRNLVDYAPCNNQHRLFLLEAEAASLLGEAEAAVQKYNLAIDAAGVSMYIHEQAICNERAGDYFLRQGNAMRAAIYYGEANELFSQWGAREKNDHLCKNIPL